MCPHGDIKSKEARHVSYTVLARRYRSRDFDEVVGQEPIASGVSESGCSRRAGVCRGRTAFGEVLPGRLHLFLNSAPEVL